MIHCLHCGAEASNGLALCDLCRRYVTEILGYLPTYFRNLARWRPGRAGSRQVPGSRVLYDGEVRTGGDRVTRALDEANNALATWARSLADDRPEVLSVHPLEAIFADLSGTDLTEAEVVTWLCHGFERHLTSISTLDWAGEFVRELSRHEHTLRLLTEDVAPGWYAGGCKGCGFGTYVIPGFTWITCRGCGTTTAARDHLEVVLEEARGWVARPRALASTVVALVDTEPSVERLHDRIRQWEYRGRLTAVRVLDGDGDPIGPKRYRLGDVLDLVFTEPRSGRDSERMGA